MQTIIRHYTAGECRIIKRYAWLPRYVRFYGRLGKIYYDRRWLETVYILQRRDVRNRWWKNEKYVTREEYEAYNAYSDLP